MALIDTTALHHVRLTVTDIERSKAFYSDVLGFEVAAESPGSPDDPEVRDSPEQLYGGVVFQTNGMLLGLRPVADPDDRFDSARVGSTTSASRSRPGRRSMTRSNALTSTRSRTARYKNSPHSGSRSCPSRTPTGSTWS